MSFWNNITKQGAYFIAHPLLRAYRILTRQKASGARAIITKGDEILLIRNIGVTYWSLPGGVLKRWETPMMCLRRELKEELGITIHSADYRYRLGTYQSEHGDHTDTIHIFVIEIPSFYYKRQWELDEARWFKRDALPENLSPATDRRLTELRRDEKNIIAKW
ncbi:MAG TPA: NUDIX domain-containing protein [Candidatus Paceibacterota bacterium]